MRRWEGGTAHPGMPSLYAPALMARTNGQTLGRMVTGIRVVRANGEPMTFSYAMLREVAWLDERIELTVFAAIDYVAQTRPLVLRLRRSDIVLADQLHRRIVAVAVPAALPFDHDGFELNGARDPGGIEAWLRLADAVGLAREEVLDQRLEREGRRELAQACFDFLPTRTALDLLGWDETDIFAHS